MKNDPLSNSPDPGHEGLGGGSCGSETWDGHASLRALGVRFGRTGHSKDQRKGVEVKD